MNKKLLALGVAASSLVGIYSALNGVAYHEIFHRKAKLPGKINSNMKTKEGVNREPDERVLWLRQQEFEEYRIADEKGLTLSGHLLPAKEKSDVYVLCSHGYRNNGKGEFRYIVKYYHDKGYNVLLIDHRASGESMGSYISFGFHESKAVLLWIDDLKEKFGKDIQIILHGISMGSATAMMLCDNEKILPNVKFIIEDCGYTSVKAQFESVLSGAGVPSFPIMGSVGIINKCVQGFFFGDVKPIEHVKKAIVPMLFIHGGKDNFVPTKMVNELYDVCPTDKDILIVEGASHGYSYKKNSAVYEEKINEFIDKYIK